MIAYERQAGKILAAILRIFQALNKGAIDILTVDGSDLLNLEAAKGHLSKFLANGTVKSYIGHHEPGILTHLELEMNTVSMEEAVQQRQKAEV